MSVYYLLSRGGARVGDERRAPSLASLPDDIVLEIAYYLSTLSDRLHLSLTSTEIFTKTISSVYAHVHLEGPTQCERTLRMLKRSPGIARHVQSLIVKPEKSPITRKWDHAHTVSVMVGAACRHMDALSSYFWDGEDILPDDRMWDQLRKSCPNLKHIGTTMGSFLPSPNSHLWKFRNLEGFSIVFRPEFYAHLLHIPTRESAPVFNKLWEMITIHSPNLKSITITGDGFSPDPIDVTPLLHAYWPQLRFVTLGDMTVSSQPQSESVNGLAGFLARHSTIEQLDLSGFTPLHPHTMPPHASISPAELATLSVDALPKLSVFSGTLDHLRALIGRGAVQDQAANNVHNMLTSSPLSQTLHTVRFPEPMQLRDLTPLAISSVLQDLHALRSLTISFQLTSGYDSNGVLRTIVSSCPALEHLDLTCGCKPSFYLESFSRTLRSLSKLTSLSLTIVKVPGDEPMHMGASRIALSNPRLRTFTIIYLPPNSIIARDRPNPVPVEVGRYELVCDVHGIPIKLLVWERKRRLGVSLIPVPFSRLKEIPWRLGIPRRAIDVPPFPEIPVMHSNGTLGKSKRWTCELRPYGHPDVPKKKWTEVLLERGPAGEEARLLVFCLWLLLLTVWGMWRAAE